MSGIDDARRAGRSDGRNAGKLDQFCQGLAGSGNDEASKAYSDEYKQGVADQYRGVHDPSPPRQSPQNSQPSRSPFQGENGLYLALAILATVVVAIGLLLLAPGLAVNWLFGRFAGPKFLEASIQDAATWIISIGFWVSIFIAYKSLRRAN